MNSIPFLSGVAPFAGRALRGKQPLSLFLFSTVGTILLCLIIGKVDALGEAPHIPAVLLAVLDAVCLGLLGSLLLFGAPTLAGTAMAQEIRSGTLDQLRMTPLSPSSLIFGVTLGSPAVCYLLCAGPALVHLGLALLGAAPLAAAVTAVVVLGLGSLALSMLSIALPLCTPRGRINGAVGALPVAMLAAVSIPAMALSGVSKAAILSYLSPAGAVSALYIDQVRFWRITVLPRLDGVAEAGPFHGWVPFLSICLSFGLAILGAVVSARQLRDPEAPALSRRQSIAAFSASLLLLLVPLLALNASTESVTHEAEPRFFEGIGMLYAYLPVLAVFGAIAAPSRRRFVQHLRGTLPAGQEGRSAYGAMAAMVLMLLLVTMVVMGPAVPAWLANGHPGERDAMVLLGLWAWLLILLVSAVQLGRAVLLSAASRGGLVVAVMVAALGMMISLTYRSAMRHQPGAVQIEAVMALLGFAPLVFFWIERRAAARLRAG